MSLFECKNADFFIYAKFLLIENERYPVIITITEIKNSKNIKTLCIDLRDQIFMSSSLQKLYKRKQELYSEVSVETISLKQLSKYLKFYLIEDEEFLKQFVTYGDQQKRFFEKYLPHVANVQTCLILKSNSYIKYIDSVSIHWASKIHKFQNDISINENSQSVSQC